MVSNRFVLLFSLFLSLPFLFLLAPRIFPLNPPPSPITDSDEIDDLNLFRRAVVSSSLSRVSYRNRLPKIAFMFLTNTDLHFAPLWDRFFSSEYKHLFNIYVHADPSVNITNPNGILRSRFISRAKRTFRASPTLISATRRLLATAILDDPANAYFAVLSQYCIPLHSFKFVYDSLFNWPNFDFSDSELGSESETETETETETWSEREKIQYSVRYGIRLRYKSFIEVKSKGPRLWKRYAARGRFVMNPEVPFEKFRAGSQFFVLTRHHALLVVEDRVLWDKFKLPCYREDDCFPEEHYFPTLLSMVDSSGLTRYTLTRVNWTGTYKGHPYTYKPKEVTPQLIHELRKSNHSSSYLFARKFSPDCLKPLLKITDSVIFRD